MCHETGRWKVRHDSGLVLKHPNTGLKLFRVMCGYFLFTPSNKNKQVFFQSSSCIWSWCRKAYRNFENRLDVESFRMGCSVSLLLGIQYLSSFEEFGWYLLLLWMSTLFHGLMRSFPASQKL